MSPYQQIFSSNAILSVWRNLRTHKDHNDLLLTLQYHEDDVRGQNGKRFGKSNVGQVSQELQDGKMVDGRGKSIGFVVPWRSMQAQRKELREKEKELAEALVVLSGEVAFTDLSPTLQSSLTQNPLIQIRHLAAGLSRQMSKVELQLAENEPFARGKNLYTGSEIAQKFLPAIQTLFEQDPVPQRMIFELLMELKDLVYMGMAGCNKQVLEWEVDGEGAKTLEELDDAIVRAVVPVVPAIEPAHKPEQKKLLHRKASNLTKSSSSPKAHPQSSLLEAPAELLYALESLETTAAAFTQLSLPIPDFTAHSVITLRRLAPRQLLNDLSTSTKTRQQKCAEYACCMKWAGTTWRQGGGCRRGCKNEDEDPSNLPSWHRSSRWFDENGSGTFMVGGGRAKESDGDAFLKMIP